MEIVASYPIPFKKALSVKDPGYEASGDRGEGETLGESKAGGGEEAGRKRQGKQRIGK